MSQPEWYRRKTWTTLDEHEFFNKLGRARKDNRAEYLKLQAIELIDTRQQSLLHIAEELLNKMLTEFPEDNFNRSSAFHNLGDIYKLREDYQKAIHYYKQALHHESLFPQVQTQAFLDYSELVVKSRNTALFDEVEQILLHNQPSLLLPIQKFKVNRLLAIIHADRGDLDKAKYFERLAREIADAKSSGLQYHKQLSMVDLPDHWPFNKPSALF